MLSREDRDFSKTDIGFSNLWMSLSTASQKGAKTSVPCNAKAEAPVPIAHAILMPRTVDRMMVVMGS